MSTQLENDTIQISWTFNASPEDIFDAWTNPDWIRRWMYSGENNDIIQVITDPVTNGEFCVLKEDRERELVDYCGTYHEVVRPNLLSFSLESPLRYNGTSSVVIRLTSDAERCHMDFLQTGINPGLIKNLWPKMFGHLAALLKAKQ